MEKCEVARKVSVREQICDGAYFSDNPSDGLYENAWQQKLAINTAGHAG